MNKFPITVGTVVKSKMGRDIGRTFIVVKELDADFVLMVNGELRGMDKPKKKRRKHLKPLAMPLEGFAERLNAVPAIQDHEIRSLLAKEAEQLVEV